MTSSNEYQLLKTQRLHLLSEMTKRRILTFNLLESENVWFFCAKHDWNNYLMINIVVGSFWWTDWLNNLIFVDSCFHPRFFYSRCLSLFSQEETWDEEAQNREMSRAMEDMEVLLRVSSAAFTGVSGSRGWGQVPHGGSRGPHFWWKKHQSAPGCPEAVRHAFCEWTL